MQRREFIGLMGTAALSFPRPGHAQTNTGLPLVGYLTPSTPELGKQALAALRIGLQAEGLIEGVNYSLATRFAGGDMDRLPVLASELATLKPRVIVMQERFLPSARVQYFPMCEHLGGGRFVSRLSGKIQQVAFSERLVNATFLDTQVPSTHTPSFQVAEGVKLVTPNLLPIFAPGHQRYVILGGGKTAMDVGIWLLQMGARPESIRWIVPQDSWLRNRDTTQPGDAFFERTASGMANQFEAAAEATSIADLFKRLERGGQMLRIDRTVWPTAFRGATLSVLEVEALSSIKDVVRKGRVRRIERDAIILERGKVDAAPDDLYVDCTAKAFSKRPMAPVFHGDQITLQQVRPGRLCFSAAFIAHVEVVYDDDAIKNDLCAPISTPDIAADWLGNMLSDLRNGRRWATEKALGRWIAEHRLSGAGFPDTGAASAPEGIRILERLREARPRAAANLARLVAELNHPN